MTTTNQSNSTSNANTPSFMNEVIKITHSTRDSLVKMEAKRIEDETVAVMQFIRACQANPINNSTNNTKNTANKPRKADSSNAR